MTTLISLKRDSLERAESGLVGAGSGTARHDRCVPAEWTGTAFPLIRVRQSVMASWPNGLRNEKGAFR